jgi:hypothetical protein
MGFLCKEENMSIKDILDKHNQKAEQAEDLKSEEEQRFEESEERARNFIINIISPALKNLKKEFEVDGMGRKTSLEIKPESFYASITILNENIKEFYYELNLKVNERDFWIKLVYHHLKKNGTFNYMPEMDLNLRKPLPEITEADIRNDFYQRFDQYLVLRDENL